MPEVDAVVPTHDATTIVSHLNCWRTENNEVQNYGSCEQQKFSSSEQGDPRQPFQRTRQFIKIQDGCARFCAYCRVPLARGTPRSVPPAQVQRAVRRAAEQGFPEIVLTGIHLAGYDSDGLDIVGLVERVLAMHAIPRVRLSSLDAAAVNDRLLHLMANAPALLPHLHIPLQSGSEAVLPAAHAPDDKRGPV
jgi:threonylcarbamoyladenosine tRNA methylthiotransferase MtaB